jgi:hypothetical protein
MLYSFPRQHLLDGIGGLLGRGVVCGVFGVTCFASLGSASGSSIQQNVTWDAQAFGLTTVEEGVKFIRDLQLMA